MDYIIPRGIDVLYSYLTYIPLPDLLFDGFVIAIQFQYNMLTVYKMVAPWTMNYNSEKAFEGKNTTRILLAKIPMLTTCEGELLTISKAPLLMFLLAQ